MAPKATPGTPSRTSRRISTAAASAPAASASKSKAKPRASIATPKKKPAAKGAAASKASAAASAPSDELLEIEKDEASAKDAVGGMAVAAGLKRKRPVGRPPRQSMAKRVAKEGVNAVPKPSAGDGPPKGIFIWGSGGMGALGLGPDEMDEVKRPRLHSFFAEGIEDGLFGKEGRGIERAVAGGMHNLVIDEAGKVWSWGVNDGAALGRLTANQVDEKGEKIDSDELEFVPKVVEALQEENFRAVEVAAGDSISVAIGEEGDVRAWGSFRSAEGLLGFDGSPNSSRTQFKPIPLPSLSKHRFSAVACGTDHVLALTVDGHVYVWGNGQQNQLGRRIIERRKINGLAPERLALRNIVKIGAGDYHSFAIDKDGHVYAWGLNSLHQTGVSDARGGDEDIIQVPTLVDALEPSEHNGAKVIQISGGEHHSLFLFDNGTVWGCGRADGSQLGLGAEHPAMVALRERAEEEKKALLQAKKNKAVKAAEDAGEDVNMEEVEQLSGPPAVDEFVPEPVQIFFPPKPTADNTAPPFEPYPVSAEEYTPHPMVSISAGSRHNLAVSADGNVYAWGYGNSSQLGLGDTETAEVPQRVRSKAIYDYNVVDASAGGQHCIVTVVPKQKDGAAAEEAK